MIDRRKKLSDLNLREKTAVELREMLKNKECSSVEIFKDCINGIKSNDENIKAYLTLNEEEGLKSAQAADEAIASGKNISPLTGIPMSVKDNISTKGLRTTCSSKMLENYIPPFDASVTEKIKSQMIPIIGKTNMDEFAMGSSTETSYFQKTKNPRDLTCVPGGSSGGAAASVASNEAIVGIGSDTGGSIRQPAAFCGVVGMKPTYGTISRYGLIAFASSLDQIGPLTKCVADSALVLDAIKGYDEKDETSEKISDKSFFENLNDNIKGKKIGIPKEFFGEGVDDEIKEKVMSSIKELEKNGAEIVEVSLPNSQYAINTYYIIASAEASSNLARYDGVRYGYRAKNYTDLTDMYVKSRSEGFGDEVKRRIMLGTFVLSSGFYDAYYKKARKVQKIILDEFKEAFKNCDVIATPTTPTTAFKFGQNSDDPVKMYYNDILTVPVNIAGLPAISVPCGISKNNLPIGMQFIGNKFCDQSVLDAAYSYEKISGGFNNLTK